MSVYEEIAEERDYQDAKFGVDSDDTKNDPWMWNAYIAQQASRWMKGKFTFDEGDVDDFRKAMLKVAATAVAAIQSLDRQREGYNAPFYQADVR